MGCFQCCMSEEKMARKSLKKSIKEYHDTKTLASFANISFKTGKLLQTLSKFLYLINFTKIMKKTFFPFYRLTYIFFQPLHHISMVGININK